MGAALLALNQLPLSGTELTAFAQVLSAHALPFHARARPTLDTCGTGGDARQGVHTANLSTLSALALAQMGVDIVKHGSRSASSLCGSADLLEALGMDLDRPQALLEADLGAHPLRLPVRPALPPGAGPHRARSGAPWACPRCSTCSGPLLNPARPEFQVLGVAREEWLEPVAAALAAGGLEGALVVHGLTAEGLGMDEASLDGPTLIQPVRDGRLLEPVRLLPEDLRLQRTPAGPGRRLQGGVRGPRRGLAAGREHPDFSPRVAEEVALQAALGLLLVRSRPFSELPALVAEARATLLRGLHLPSLLALAA